MWKRAQQVQIAKQVDKKYKARYPISQYDVSRCLAVLYPSVSFSIAQTTTTRQSHHQVWLTQTQ
jgi:hypothetical protein